MLDAQRITDHAAESGRVLRYLGTHDCSCEDADGSVECYALWGGIDGWNVAFYFSPGSRFPDDEANYDEGTVPWTLSYVRFCPSCGEEVTDNVKSPPRR